MRAADPSKTCVIQSLGCGAGYKSHTACARSASIHREWIPQRYRALDVQSFGTLSFGHYGPLGGGRQLTAGDSMLQAIDLAQGMDDLGVNGAYFRVHYFAGQQSWLHF